MKTGIINKSKELFDSGYGCAEAVLMAVAEYKNIQSELIPRIATGFCAGAGRTNNMCGAVTGAIIAINLNYGRNTNEEDKDLNYRKVQEFIKIFQLKSGSVQCTELTGCDLSSEEGRQQFKDLNIHPKCKEFVGEATKTVLEIL
ncbi:MAG: C-GCAxxG-C-C family protein [Bacteroidales bacterium]|nr:C-GCAxxG-C-C family protein [Bacteroidales bacterium]